MGKGILSGYKTYIAAGVAIVTAVANYLTGVVDASLAETVNIVITAVLGMTLRAGITSVAKK